MSDSKAKRAARESVRPEFVAPEPPHTETAVAVATEMPALAESTSVPLPETPEPVGAAISGAAISRVAGPAAMQAAEMAERAGEAVAKSSDDAWAAMAEAQAALARGFEAMTAELSGATRSGVDAAAEAATALLGARTFAEVVEINAGLARRSFDKLVGSSTKLSEIGIRAATEASTPLLARLGAVWTGPRLN